MILDLDCGNSLIKWRIIDAPAPGLLVEEGVATHVDSLLSCVRSISVKVSRCRLVSVRSDVETKLIKDAVTDSLGVEVACATPAKRVGGVLNGYESFEQLGLDRWLAIIGAYHLCNKACVVVDLGTAVTIDFVSSKGCHLGGYIVPGMFLLRNQLHNHTRRIRYDASETQAALQSVTPGKRTGEAVERGCFLMLRAYIESQILMAEELLGPDFVMYVTGGDVALVADMQAVERVPDLVFKGLAIACP